MPYCTYCESEPSQPGLCGMGSYDLSIESGIAEIGNTADVINVGIGYKKVVWGDLLMG